VVYGTGDLDRNNIGDVAYYIDKKDIYEPLAKWM
jgi:hypothetical protein